MNLAFFAANVIKIVFWSSAHKAFWELEWLSKNMNLCFFIMSIWSTRCSQFSFEGCLPSMFFRGRSLLNQLYNIVCTKWWRRRKANNCAAEDLQVALLDKWSLDILLQNALCAPGLFVTNTHIFFCRFSTHFLQSSQQQTLIKILNFWKNSGIKSYQANKNIQSIQWLKLCYFKYFCVSACQPII